MKPLKRQDPQLSGRVLILGHDTLSFLSSIRSLGRAGLSVDVGWVRLRAPALRSRYIRRVLRLPELRADGSLWVEALNAEMETMQYDMVLPCYDSHALVLQAQRENLLHAERYVLLGERTYSVCSSKASTHELAASLGIPVPRQRRARSVEDLLAAGEEFGYPLVVKPEASVSADDPTSRHPVKKVFERKEVHPWGSVEWPEGGFLVQQHFIGRGVGVEFLARDGELKAVFQHERLHEPLRGGWGSYRRSVPLHPELLDSARKLAASLSYTGPGMVEFKVDPQTGRWVLLEINGRLWGSLPLTLAAGYDVPRYLYEMWCLGRSEFPRSYRTNVYARNWNLDWEWMIANLRADRRDPLLMTVPLWRVAGEVLNAITLRERSDTLAWDDRSPALAEVKDIVRGFATRALRRLSAHRSTLRGRAEAALRAARSVLFLCLGNICRSPFAEGAARNCGRTVGSAGTLLRHGRPAPKPAVEAARRFAIDLSEHRSRSLSRAMAEQAEVIFIFDRNQEQELEAAFPESLGKVHFLSALDPSLPLEIEDPYGRPEADFVETYRKIYGLMQLPVWQSGRGNPSV